LQKGRRHGYDHPGFHSSTFRSGAEKSSAVKLAFGAEAAYTSMMQADHITDWIFDLDNTLYPRHCDLFGQIDIRMTAYVARITGLEPDEARLLQKQLYRDHGTTLAGLMTRYRIDPHHYLADVHDIDYSTIEPAPALGTAIAALPGRKHIFTNGDFGHAERTLAALGFGHVFDKTFDIVAAGFEPKPRKEAYRRFIEAHCVVPACAIMFEDIARNLEIPKTLGMKTVLVIPCGGKTHSAEAWELEGRGDAHVDHVTDDLAEFVKALRNENALAMDEPQHPRATTTIRRTRASESESWNQ
jgi:putative hydrolase of the HAD superfamily